MFNIIKLFVKYSLMAYAFSYLLTWITFVLYNAYYGWFIFLSYFLPFYALNILMYTIIWIIIYTIYKKLYT